MQTFETYYKNRLCEAFKPFQAVHDIENRLLSKEANRSSTAESCEMTEA
jgi:hypothetical protein